MAFGNGCERLRVQPEFLNKDAGGKGVGRVGGEHRDARLSDDGTGIEFGHDLVDGAAMLMNAR